MPIDRLFIFIFLFLSLSPAVFAEETLKLSGIMNGKRMTAIINDQIVAVGDSVGDFQISEIGADYVICEGKKGVMNLQLIQSDAAQTKPNAAPSPKKVNANSIKNVQPAPVSSSDGQGDQKARKHLERSLEYLRQGDVFLKSPLVFERIFSKAAELCDAADREAQAAFRSVSGEALREGVKQHINKIQQAKQAILKEKANFNTRVKSMIAARQVITGMTSQNVISSWGVPLMKNRDGEVEKWVYQDNNGYQKELVFKDGIMVSF